MSLDWCGPERNFQVCTARCVQSLSKTFFFSQCYLLNAQRIFDWASILLLKWDFNKSFYKSIFVDQGYIYQKLSKAKFMLKMAQYASSLILSTGSWKSTLLSSIFTPKNVSTPLKLITFVTTNAPLLQSISWKGHKARLTCYIL